jgi:catechol 2,3-dioxygenase-like lactoylglutathione lyase family enzyme
MLLGLRSAFCYVDDIVAAKTWYSKVLGFPPYFDQPFYVGFNVGGYELGLSPGNTPRAYGAYWGVKDVRAVYARLLELGAEPRSEIQNVGPDDKDNRILIADVLDPWGNVFGIIENPSFKLSV